MEAEWKFSFIRYPHADSNVPYHQPAGVFQGQLVRFRTLCNSICAFKQATTQLVRRKLSRGHKPWILVKGWNAHLQKFSNDRINNYSRLRQWFRRMLWWSQCNPMQPPSKRPYPLKHWVLKQQPLPNMQASDKKNGQQHSPAPSKKQQLKAQATKSLWIPKQQPVQDTNRQKQVTQSFYKPNSLSTCELQPTQYSNFPPTIT